MNEVKISVIIPVYNTEEYLQKCLNSVINQTFKDIEIICINDGSTDKSLEILEEYSKKDDRIKILSQKNKGAGAARNYGLKIAKGEYISFVDSDDWIELATYERLYDIAVSKDVDMIFFKMINYNNGEDRYYHTDYYDLIYLKEFFTNSTYDFHDLKDYLFKIPVSPCNKIYKRSFLENINAKFNEGLIFEDNPFFFKNILKAKKIFLYDEYFYIRRRTENSVMHLVNKNHFAIIQTTNQIIQIFKDSGLFEKFKKELLNKKITLIRNLVYDRLDENYKDDFFELVRNDFSIIKRNYNLNNDYENNLIPINQYFYLNSEKTTNFREFDLLNKNSYLESKINDLRQNFEANKKLLRERNSRLEKLNFNLKEKNTKLWEKNTKLNKKNKELNDTRNKIKDELNEVYSSNSWKVTKPIRRISNKFNK